MEAGAKSLRFLGEGKKLLIPFFQRRYVWRELNWEELVDTFENKDIKPFLGSIIIKHLNHKEDFVIDGQQRLTTITILAKAIYDSLPEESKQPGSGMRTCIEKFLFYTDNSADDFEDSHVKIKHSYLDCQEYERVIKSCMLDNIPKINLNDIDDDSGNILLCYKYFREKLSSYSVKQLKSLFNSIFNEDRKVFVLIELNKEDINEQKIFDTINRAGVHLSTADIIKNNIFKYLLNYCGDEPKKKNILEIYKDCWENVFEKNQKVSNLWDTERVFGNVKHSNLEFLLYCVACSKWGEKGDMFAKLEEVFEKHISTMKYQELLDLVKEIKEYALIFKKYVLNFKEELDNEEKDVYFKYEDHVSRLLLILQKFSIQMFYPYIIKRLYEVDQNEKNEALIHDFKILESFVVRRKISPRGTHDYAAKCYEIIKNGVEVLFNDQNSSITDEDIRVYLANTKDDAAKMILFWIELYQRYKIKYDVDILEFKYTLEHIMPKKWEKNWSVVPIVNNGTVLSATSDVGKRFRNTVIQSIGNKTLLLHSLNVTVKNSSFDIKLNGIDNKKPGYKNHTGLLITKRLVDNACVSPIWNEAKIKEREKQLADIFIEIWPSFYYDSNNLSSNQKSKIRSISTSPFEDVDISNFTDEQFDDPIKLLEAMDDNLDNDYDIINKDLLSINDFTKKVTVQAETINKYIKENKIIPDVVILDKPYFTDDTVKSYAKKFNWIVITDENRKNIFTDMLEKNAMSYSYKPLFLKAFFENADENGSVSLDEIVIYFIKYYSERRRKGLVVENAKSAFANENVKYSNAKQVIIKYPLKRFENMSVVSFDKETKLITMDKAIWNSLSQSEISHIIAICNNKLEYYYKRIEKQSI